MRSTTAAEMDDRLTAMGCHQRPNEPAAPCAGFMVRVGFRSIGIRLAAIAGVAHPDDYSDGGHDLYETFDEMIAAHHRGVE